MVSNDILIRMQLINGMGRKTISKLLTYIELKKIKLYEFYDLLNLINDLKIKKLKIDREKIEEEYSRIIESCEKNKIQVVGIYDKNYPYKLNSIEDKPIVLYVDGDIDLLNGGNNIAIVGTRKPSQEGYEISSIFAEKLAEENCCIVSGLASGCDEAAHQGCLLAKGKTIAVIPSGHLNVLKMKRSLYNKIILSGGCIVSELSPLSKAEKYSFIDRNRIIAAVSEGVIVVEGGLTGGTSHTVKFARKYNKEIAYTTNICRNTGQTLMFDNIDVIDSFEKLVKFKNKSIEKVLDKAISQ
ncbi:MAG TPA: DNA-processing protein DprA [Tissierellia bacterium]|jgi:DNA processing protein|nr:DNA-processing protein DprA [Tissierellia bacterium]